MATVARTRNLRPEVRGAVVEALPALAVGRVLLTRREAAASLSMSLSHFQRHVQPFMPCVYSGQLRLYRLSDLERWAEGAVSIPNRR